MDDDEPGVDGWDGLAAEGGGPRTSPAPTDDEPGARSAGRGARAAPPPGARSAGSGARAASPPGARTAGRGARTAPPPMERDAPGSGLDGGGALSAKTLALAAGLLADAAGRAVTWEGAAGARAQALALARRALALGVANEEAYRDARAALAGDLPRAPAATRDYVLGDLVQRAAQAPLELARAAADTAVLGAHVADHAPGPAAADAIAAAAIATGVARAATHLVAINLATCSDGPELSEARSEVRRASAALPGGV